MLHVHVDIIRIAAPLEQPVQTINVYTDETLTENNGNDILKWSKRGIVYRKNHAVLRIMSC